MKKKIIIYATVAVVVIAIVALAIFAFSGKSGENEKSAVTLIGVWKVATDTKDGIMSMPQNEYMVFSDAEACDYRNGDPLPFAKSTYKISGDVLEFTDISRTYHIALHTNQYITLYTNDDTYMTLVYAESENLLKETFDFGTMSGKWNVTYRQTEAPIVNEYLIFEDGVLSDYRDNSEQPTIEAEYTWNDNIISAPALGVEMMGSRVATDRVILIDIKDGNIWILSKATE